MHTYSRGLVRSLLWVEVGLVAIVVFHLGGSFSHLVGQFAPLCGAFIGGTLTLLSAAWPRKRGEQTEVWLNNEQLSWLLIGCGILAWGMGESFWQYYVSIGQSPFPSIADAGYSLFPLFIFGGLLLQPPPVRRSRRSVLLLDSLISMGSIFAIAWYLLLGSLAQAPGEANLAKFLGIYYPTTDTALLSCIIFLLLRGHGRAYQVTSRRLGLLVAGIGVAFFVSSDFLFNIQNNAGTYVQATWVDLGWPLGMVTIGIAAYVRRFLPATPETVIEQRVQQVEEGEHKEEQQVVSTPQFVPYGLLALLFLSLTYDVLSNDPGQRAIRPVLLISTLLVVGLVILRQLFTLWENTRLAQRQAEALQELAQANKRIEEQARQIASHNAELEQGIEHLKSVQANIANGNLRARAHLTHGALLPLAGSLNLMAERLMKLGQASHYAGRLSKALSELGTAFERTALGHPFLIPESCGELPEMQRLLVAMRVKRITGPAASQSNQPHVQVAPPPQSAQTPFAGRSMISSIGQVRASGSLHQGPSLDSASPFPPLPVTPPMPHPVTQAMTIPNPIHAQEQEHRERPVSQPLQSDTGGRGLSGGNSGSSGNDRQARQGTRQSVYGLRPSPNWDGLDM